MRFGTGFWKRSHPPARNLASEAGKQFPDDLYVIPRSNHHPCKEWASVNSADQLGHASVVAMGEVRCVKIVQEFLGTVQTLPVRTKEVIDQVRVLRHKVSKEAGV
eukprot:CAMPEP_0177624770 /NCGR_PEP_ID=MMETSP0419_2-20121207/29686_1 /TAXON_ID=582737 /ORGANISM="Tetraselmis sp., Strain GSL018" /LENGTH=104 /DNA_ID=CAMNT_0019125557 /DNA_START=454 /DNA_END=768 /DNA_ORIENTATION=+